LELLEEQIERESKNVSTNFTNNRNINSYGALKPEISQDYWRVGGEFKYK
jgi:hypothetical protein